MASDGNKPAHARYSPSGADKWMNCIGSVAMEDGLADSGSTYAREGTCAHMVAALCLTQPCDPVVYLGKRFDVEGQTFECNHEMVGAVRMYTRAVFQRIQDYKLAGATVELHVDQEVPIGHLTGEEGATGTADVVIIAIFKDGTAVVDVWDLKYGKGVFVSVVENKQTRIYALGALRKFEFSAEFTKAKMNIHQPRLNDKPSEWECSIEELLAFGKEVTEKAGLASDAFRFKDQWLGPEGSEHYLTPGEKQCQFCRAKALCPALAKHVRDAVGAEFQVLAYATVDTAPIPPPSNNAELGVKMAAIPLINLWCKAIKVEVEAKLNSGEEVPGWKLVLGQKGDRVWIDESAAEKTLKGFRLKSEEIYNYKLISPTQAEKLLKSQPKRWVKVEPLYGRAEAKPMVAEASDKRPAYVAQTAASDFEVLPAADVGDLS